MRQTPKIHEIYKHFKGQYYQIEGIAIDAVTEKYMVVYRATYGDHALYVRELENFMSKVDRVKYPDAEQEYRFEPVDENDEEQPVNQELYDFIEAKDARERLTILERMRGNVDDAMINTMAVILDSNIPEGPLEQRYMALKDVLLLHVRYEGTRLR